MLKIIIELHPFGNAEKKQKIAEMDLWNTGAGSLAQGSYEGSATTEPSPWNKNVEKRGGKVYGHLRSNNVWTLVAKMLHQMGYGVSSSYQKNEVRRAVLDNDEQRRDAMEQL